MNSIHGSLSDYAKFIPQILADALILVNSDAIITDVNEATLRLLKYEKRELIGLSFSEITRLQSAGGQSLLQEIGLDCPPEKSTVQNVEMTCFDKFGQKIPVSFSGTLILDASAKCTGAICIAHDLTSIKKEKAKCIENELRINAIIGTTVDAIIITNERGIIQTFNLASEKLFGFKAKECVGQNVSMLMPENNRGKHDDYMKSSHLNDTKRVIGTNRKLYGRHKDGTVFPMTLAVSEALVGQERVYTGVIRDLSESKRAEEISKMNDSLRALNDELLVERSKLSAANHELQVLATHDSLTGLYNRASIIDHIQQEIYNSERNGENFCVIYFDIDNFKYINDSCGHAYGDEILKAVVERIKSTVRECDIMARMGGDEFVLLASRVSENEYFHHLARRLLEAFATSFSVEEQRIYLTSSIGIAVYPGCGKAPEELIKNADIAMYNAKKSGRNDFRFYSNEMSQAITMRMGLESEIRNALDEEELRLYYQPRIDSKTCAVIGAEALIRWQHPQRGLLSPIEFIPTAEKSDLIIDIGCWVRERVCQQLLAWKKSNQFSSLKISMNVSPIEFMRGNILQNIIDLVLKYDIDQSLMELEITENTLMKSVLANSVDYEIIRNMGIGLSIDDFGTGYCSLGYLRQYPIDTLKIDKSFIDNLDDEPRDAAIVKTIIAMSTSLGMSVVAEGVERESQKEFLLRHGCNQIQGYYYSPPLNVDEFENYMNLHHF